jgi:hypothetical protein
MYSYKMTVKGSFPIELFKTMVNMINHGIRFGTTDFELKNKLKGYLPPKEISGFLAIVKEYYLLDKVKDRIILNPTHSFLANQISERHCTNLVTKPDSYEVLFSNFKNKKADGLIVKANDIITASAFNNLSLNDNEFDKKWIGMIMSNLSNNTLLPLISATSRGITNYRDLSNSKTSFITRKFFTKEDAAGWVAVTDVTSEEHIGQNNVFKFTSVDKYGFYYGTSTVVETVDFQNIMKAPNVIDLILTFMTDKGFKVKF